MAFFLNSWHKISYKSPSASLIIRCVASDVSCPRLALRTSLPVRVSSSQIDCCCCESQLLLSVTFRRGSWVWESFEQYTMSVWSDYFIIAICWHRTVYDDCMRLRLPKLQILDLGLGVILPNKRHPDYVSNRCDSTLFESRKDWVVWRR